MRATQTSLPQLGDPSSLLIVAFDNHFLGFRHAGYYLPGYTTIEYPEASLVQGKQDLVRDQQLIVAKATTPQVLDAQVSGRSVAE